MTEIDAEREIGEGVRRPGVCRKLFAACKGDSDRTRRKMNSWKENERERQTDRDRERERE